MLKLGGAVEDVFAPVRHARIADAVQAYLATVEPRPVFDMPAASLRARILDSIRCAEGLGVDRIAAHKRFAYLWLLSDGQLGHTPEALDFIRFGGADPNTQVQALMQQTLRAIREGAAGPDA